MKIKAALAREKGKVTIEELELGAPQAGEVLVKMVASGICHTDFTTLNLEVPTTLPQPYTTLPSMHRPCSPGIM